MRPLRAFLIGLKALLHKDQRNLELDEELRDYLEASTQEKIRRGMTHADAMRASRAEMGTMETVKEKVHSAGWESFVESIWQDIRYGLRQLFRSPGFTLTAVLTLALGIGANTAIFTLVHAVMLKQLPIANPHELYRIGEGEYYCCEWGGLEGSWGTFDYPFYKHLRDTSPSFAQLAAFSGGGSSFNVRRAGSTAAALTTNGEYVSGNYFSTLGIQAQSRPIAQSFRRQAGIANDGGDGIQRMAKSLWRGPFGRRINHHGQRSTSNARRHRAAGILRRPPKSQPA